MAETADFFFLFLVLRNRRQHFDFSSRLYLLRLPISVWLAAAVELDYYFTYEKIQQPYQKILGEEAICPNSSIV